MRRGVKKKYLSDEKAQNAFSFHYFAANYPRFRPVAYFSIASRPKNADSSALRLRFVSAEPSRASRASPSLPSWQPVFFDFQYAFALRCGRGREALVILASCARGWVNEVNPERLSLARTMTLQSLSRLRRQLPLHKGAKTVCTLCGTPGSASRASSYAHMPWQLM